MKILTVVGARPQFIKAATVSREMANRPDIQEVIVHTGQHFDVNMSEVFFREMNIPEPDYNLQISSVSHGAMTGRMLEKIEEVLLVERPDYVLVYGDTNSTLAGALAAKKLHIPVVHVEAGLRSFNMSMPEEINRILTDRISDILCCPTASAVDNLHREGFDTFGSRIINTGDVMLDATLYYSEHSAKRSTIIQKLGLNYSNFLLCTVHREENTDNLERLLSIMSALNLISKETQIVFPMHPRTKRLLMVHGVPLSFDPIDPVGYFDILELIKRADIVMTDSGGLQKEAYFLGKPCVILRKETEWVELLDDPCYRVSGTETSSVTCSFYELRGRVPSNRRALFGEGFASQIVVDLIAGNPN